MLRLKGNTKINHVRIAVTSHGAMKFFCPKTADYRFLITVVYDSSVSFFSVYTALYNFMIFLESDIRAYVFKTQLNLQVFFKCIWQFYNVRSHVATTHKEERHSMDIIPDKFGFIPLA